MNTNREFIEWFLRFTEMELETLRPGDWLNLHDDIWLLRRGLPLKREDGKGQAFLAPDETHQLTPENLTKVQRYMKELLQRFADSSRKGKGPTDLFIFEESVAGSIRSVSFAIFRSGSRWSLWPIVQSDDLRDVFLFALAGALSSIDISELRSCPSCGRLFLIEHGRQRFCSFQCKNKEAQSRYRQSQKEKENERGKANYAKKMKKKLGPNVQVKRRVQKPERRNDNATI